MTLQRDPPVLHDSCSHDNNRRWRFKGIRQSSIILAPMIITEEIFAKWAQSFVYIHFVIIGFWFTCDPAHMLRNFCRNAGSVAIALWCVFAKVVNFSSSCLTVSTVVVRGFIKTRRVWWKWSQWMKKKWEVLWANEILIEYKNLSLNI